MKTFKGYINENFKELVKISMGVDPKNSAKVEALLKKMVFGYNGPMDTSRYEKLGLDEFIVVGPKDPVMKWVGKNKAMIVKLAKLPMPKITFASVDVNQYGDEISEKLSFTKDFHKNAMGKKQKAEFDKLYKKMDGGKEHQEIKRKEKNPVKADDMFHALVMKKIIGEAAKHGSFRVKPLIKNQPSLQQVQKMKADIKKAIKVKHDLVNIQFQDILYVNKRDVKKAQQQLAKTKYKNIEVRAEPTGVKEAIDHPAFINVTLQDFAKHMKRIAPHAKKAGTKLTVKGKDVKVDGLTTAIKKMFDYMTSDGKGFYE